MRLSLFLMTILAYTTIHSAHAEKASSPTIDSISISDTALHTRYKEAPFAFGTFTLTNRSNVDLLLQGISSPDCQSVTSNRNSQVAIPTPTGADDIFQRMAIPHEATLVFPIGGYHLICHGLRVPYQPGKAVSFVFHFQNLGQNLGNVTASFVMQPIVPENNVGP